MLAGPVADARWTTEVDRERPVIITAQGLLPYFSRDEVHRMLTDWARLLPGAWLLFDAVTAGMQAVRRNLLLGVLRRVPGLKDQLPVLPVFQARLGLDAG